MKISTSSSRAHVSTSSPSMRQPTRFSGTRAARRQGPSTPLSDPEQHRSDRPHEVGQRVSVLPLLAGRKNGTHPREIDLHAVVVVLPADLLKDAQLVVADSLNREIPVAVQTLPDGVSKGLVPRVDEPVGVLLFHGQPWSAARHVVVRAVDAVGEERLQSPAARLIQEVWTGSNPVSCHSP